MMRARFPIAVALALALAACSGDSTAGSKAVEPGGAKPTETEPGATRKAKPNGGATTGATTGGTATTTTGGTRATGYEPPAPGTYRYRQEGEIRVGNYPPIYPDPEGTLEVDPAQTARDGKRQRQLRTVSRLLGSAEQVLRFAPDAVYLERASQQGFDCEPDPPLIVARVPLRVGLSWSDETACDGVELTLRAKVLRAEVRRVAGVGVDTLVLSVTRTSNGATFSETGRSTIWLSVAHRVIVREEDRSSGQLNGQPFSQDITADLIGLEPER